MSKSQKFYQKPTRIFSLSSPQQASPHLFCSVCLDIFEQPCRLLCGHTFCYICIQNSIIAQNKHTCPECKADFSRRRLEKDLLAARMVDDLHVHCMNQGCNYQGDYAGLRKHQRACRFRNRQKSKIEGETGCQGQIVVINEEDEVVEVDRKKWEMELPKIDVSLEIDGDVEQQNSLS